MNVEGMRLDDGDVGLLVVLDGLKSDMILGVDKLLRPSLLQEVVINS